MNHPANPADGQGDRTEPGGKDRPARRPCVPEAQARCPAHVVRVAFSNPGEFQENAASLHIYSKPYAECDIYDSESGPRRRVKLAYDSIQGKPVERARG